MVVFSPDSKTNTGELHSALLRVLESLPKKEIVPKAVVKKMISLEETISGLAERVSKGIRLSFSHEFSTQGELTHEKKVSIIVGFLAMLELVKRGAIKVSQEGRGEIHMETESIGLPHYV